MLYRISRAATSIDTATSPRKPGSTARAFAPHRLAGQVWYAAAAGVVSGRSRSSGLSPSPAAASHGENSHAGQAGARQSSWRDTSGAPGELASFLSFSSAMSAPRALPTAGQSIVAYTFLRMARIGHRHACVRTRRRQLQRASNKGNGAPERVGPLATLHHRRRRLSSPDTQAGTAASGRAVVRLLSVDVRRLRGLCQWTRRPGSERR